MDHKQMTKAQLLSEIKKLKLQVDDADQMHETDGFDRAFGDADDTYRTLLNSLNAGIVVHASDTSILYSNATASTLLGLSEEQLHGKKAMDPQWKFLNADRSDMALTDYPVNRLLATKEPIYNMITGINRPATEDLVWVVVNGYVDLRENGSVERAVISFVDITKRIHSEEALTKSRTLLAEAQNLAKLGAFSFDVKTMHQTWTEETFRIMEVDMGGGAPEVPEGVDFIAPKYRSMADKAIQMAIEKGESYDQEWEIVTAKGNKKWARAMGKANYENGEVVSISGSFQDITEQKQTEKELAGYREALEEKVEERTRELEEKNTELNKAMRVFVGREAKIIELQKKIKALQGK